jgi:ATP-dependent Clp protease adaptor protein ClpS
MTLRHGFDKLSLAQDSAPRACPEQSSCEWVLPEGSPREGSPWSSTTTAPPETIEETGEEVKIGGAARTDLAPPYKVIFLNDDTTTMDFVVSLLMGLFHLDQATAMRIMLEVHQTGAAVVAVLPLEEAELRQQQVHEAARAAGFPLRCLIEPA